MHSIADGSVLVQTSSQSVPSLPSWFGEVVLIAQCLRQHDVLSAIAERVRFARRRFGQYEVIDFVAVLFGYAVSGERTLEAFYEHLHPFAAAFMALFGRKRLPARSTLSRFLAALPPEPVEALRSLFLSDVLAYPLVSEEQPAGLWDRTEKQWQVFDIDGTREAARQRALPQNAELPAPQRRLRPLCAPGYTGRKRGEVVRSRTTILQAHTHQWLGSFGGSGNGKSREELRRAVAQIQRYLTAHQIPAAHALLRLDGQYGTGATLSDLAGLPFVMRGKDYQLLSRTEIQFRLSLPPDQQFSRPESALVRTLYDCPEVRVGANGERCRIVVATHPAGPTKPRVGVERNGIVYELFLTMLPQGAFTAADVVTLYLHRGSFENALSDEDTEQDPDRWCSHTAWGQECWQIVAQWVWNEARWNWVIASILIQCARRSLLLPSWLGRLQLPTRLLRCRGMGQPKSLWAGKQAASLVVTLLSSRMAPYAALPTRSSQRMSGVGKPMGACVWCTLPAFAVAVLVLCANSANGWARRQRSRVR